MFKPSSPNNIRDSPMDDFSNDETTFSPKTCSQFAILTQQYWSYTPIPMHNTSNPSLLLSQYDQKTHLMGFQHLEGLESNHHSSNNASKQCGPRSHHMSSNNMSKQWMRQSPLARPDSNHISSNNGSEQWTRQLTSLQQHHPSSLVPLVHKSHGIVLGLTCLII